MSKKKRRDPNYAREKKRYKHPIPSREYILQVLEEVGKPLTQNKLHRVLEVDDPEQQEALGYRLKAMLRDGQLMQDRRGRFCLVQRLTLIKGSVQAHPDGFGFVIPDDGSDDLFLSAKQMRLVMHGDTVLAYPSGVDRRGRIEGQIHEVLEHANKTIVGKFYIEHGVGFVIPDNTRLTQDILVPIDLSQQASNGQMVLVEVLAFPSKRNQTIAKVIEILGEHMAPGLEIDVALHAHGIPYEWPVEVMQAVTKLPKKVLKEDLEGRADLRDLNFVTIDGEDARDFDDAVYCEVKPKGGFKLYVAIADVSHYVEPGSALDKEAIKRGNSVYFPGRVVPMLPEELSNGLCSLNPKVDRLVMVSELSVSSKGRLSRSRFYKGVIHSKARLTYTKVAKWLEQGKADKTHQALFPDLCHLHQLFLLLHKARAERGAIEFDTTETKIEFDEHKKIAQIVPTTRNDAHRLIEECMLAANVATAKFLNKAKIPTLFRVHEPPKDDKLNNLREFLNEVGLRLEGGKKPTPKDFRQTAISAGQRPDKHLIETVMLRSMTQAHYQEKNTGHFGLAYKEYTHFTSPIRRYPDLLVHRAISHIISHREVVEFNYNLEEMNRLGKHCSVTERRADDATREVVSWLKCEHLLDKLGQVYAGTISAVTSFGIFVELNDIYVEGLVHVTSLRNDYYQYDATHHRLQGQRTGTEYRLGGSVVVQVVRVDLDERKIDFELVSQEELDE